MAYPLRARYALLVFVLGVVAVVSLLRKQPRYTYDVDDFTSLKVQRPPKTYDAYEDIRQTLMSSPVVIFSKSYCPYSKAAKSLLLTKYVMSHPPLVRELDQEPHGREIQDALEHISGRRTVPNVFAGGVSIGGSDDIAALDKSGELAPLFRKRVGGRFKIGRKPRARSDGPR
ncbi:thioredoxin-like protein [Dipodascopsis tothii]|uniref:thioredoxin-like protein n=1 Tax=Dipodascopsis tothii TaxID=44089 RepID=UPI0034CD109E